MGYRGSAQLQRPGHLRQPRQRRLCDRLAVRRNNPLQWNDTASNGRSRYLVEYSGDPFTGGAADSVYVRTRPLSYLSVAKRTIILIYDASLLAFFFLLRFSFFFWAELGLFLFFSLPLVLTSSLVTHICVSKSEELLIE